QEAHELMRRLTLKSEREGRPFKEVLQEDKIVMKRLNKKEIEKALNPRNYLGTTLSQIDSVVKKTMDERRTREKVLGRVRILLVLFVSILLLCQVFPGFLF